MKLKWIWRILWQKIHRWKYLNQCYFEQNGGNIWHLKGCKGRFWDVEIPTVSQYLTRCECESCPYFSGIPVKRT